MMISPGYFAEQMKDYAYPELIRERDELIRYIQEFEKKEMAGDRSDPEWRYSPSPDVRYQMHLEYLAKLCGIMHEKYNDVYVWGGRTLKDDSDGKETQEK